MQRVRPLLALFVIVLAPWRMEGQEQNDSAASMMMTHHSNQEEVDSIEHILDAAYRLISGPSGSRNWDSFRALFLPDARFVVGHGEPPGKITTTTFTIDEFIERAQAIFDKDGFYESPVANRVEAWDHMAHVWSTYESRHSPGDKPYTRGINSFQLLYDGTRWWIVTIYWQNEDASHHIPEKYLR